MDITKAIHIKTIVVEDPDSKGDVEVEVYKDPVSGSIFAVDASYIDQISVFIPGIFNPGTLQLEEDDEPAKGNARSLPMSTWPASDISADDTRARSRRHGNDGVSGDVPFPFDPLATVKGVSMFEAYRIRPVLEWEDKDESRELEPFITLDDATEARSRVLRAESHAGFEPCIFWTLYGVNPECKGVRTEDAIADVDTEGAALALLTKLVGRYHADQAATVPGYYVSPRSHQMLEDRDEGEPIEVTLTLGVSVKLLRQQKCALVNLAPGAPVTPQQDEAVEGILNLLDFIQDSIFEQGLAAEEDIFDTDSDVAPDEAQRD